MDGPRDNPPQGDRFDDLLHLVRRLRAPDGCPWDRKQTLASIRAHLLEEAHETAAAIDENDLAALAEELGDLLFQAAFVAELLREAGAATAPQIFGAVHAKLVSRHPHVFGDAPTAADAAEVERAWERRKLAERAGHDGGLLDGLPATLPALTASQRLGEKAAGVGFDWPQVAAVRAQVDAELAELDAVLATPEGAGSPEAIRHELGDLLFTVAQLARRLDLDPEAALAAANRRFRSRFSGIEATARAAGRRVDELSLEQMDAAWREAKRQERPDTRRDD